MTADWPCSAEGHPPTAAVVIPLVPLLGAVCGGNKTIGQPNGQWNDWQEARRRSSR
jgi:hypothetical protein